MSRTQGLQPRYTTGVTPLPQRELRNQAGAVLRRAKQGERFTITVDGRPVAELGPLPGTRQPAPPEALVELLAETPVDPGWHGNYAHRDTEAAIERTAHRQKRSRRDTAPQEPGTWAVSVITIGELEVCLLLQPDRDPTSTATRRLRIHPRTSTGPDGRSPRRRALRTAASRLLLDNPQNQPTGSPP